MPQPVDFKFEMPRAHSRAKFIGGGMRSDWTIEIWNEVMGKSI